MLKNCPYWRFGKFITGMTFAWGEAFQTKDSCMTVKPISDLDPLYGVDSNLAADLGVGALFAQLIDDAKNHDGNNSAASGVVTDATHEIVWGTLVNQQEDTGKLTGASDVAQQAHDILKEITEGGLAGYWKWMMKNIRENVMEEMGISEADLAAMSPTERAAVEKAIADEVEKRLVEAMKKQQDGGAGVVDLRDPAALQADKNEKALKGSGETAGSFSLETALDNKKDEKEALLPV